MEIPCVTVACRRWYIYRTNNAGPARLMTLKTATVLFSGGVDSTCCVRFFQDAGHKVRGIYFDFGQAAARAEWSAATRISERLSMSVESVQVHAQSLTWAKFRT